MGFKNITITNRSGTIAVRDVSQLVMPANTQRNYILVQNLSTAKDMYLGIGFTPTLLTGVHLPPKGGGIVFEDSCVPVEAIYIVGDRAGDNFVALEG